MRRIETYDWWPELMQLKDTLSLRELAVRFEVTPGAISAAFKRCAVRRKPASPGPRLGRSVTGASLSADIGGAPAVDVHCARPSSTQPRAPSSARGPPATLPFEPSRREPGAVGGKGAWKIVVDTGGDTVVRVVVARSLADAAARIEAAHLSRVVALEWIGEVI